MAGRDVGGILTQAEDAAVAEVDEGVGDAEFGQERAQALESVAFEDAGEVEDDGRIVKAEVAASAIGNEFHRADEAWDEVGGVDGDVEETTGFAVSLKTAGEEVEEGRGEEGCWSCFSRGGFGGQTAENRTQRRGGDGRENGGGDGGAHGAGELAVRVEAVAQAFYGEEF